MTTLLCSHGLALEHICHQCTEEGLERVHAHKPKSRKAKTCQVCKQKFIPRRDMQSCCSYPATCEAIKAEKNVEKMLARRARDERKATIKKLRDMETLPQLKKRAQTAFNAFCRTRDKLAGHPCISSGRPLDWSGNATDAGHYRSVGAAPHLRFNEDNCHAQSKHDNQYKSGNAVSYRLGLIARIGLERVEALEANNATRNYTREELIEIAAYYRQKTRELMK